jgi:hypothetical protein
VKLPGKFTSSMKSLSGSVGRRSVKCNVSVATGMRVRRCIVLTFKYILCNLKSISDENWLVFDVKGKRQDCVQCESVELLKKKIVEAYCAPNGLYSISECLL